MAYIRKISATQPPQWGPWNFARFQSESVRDGFLDRVALTEDSGWIAEATPDDARCAQVRWLPGRFLRLNDLVYSFGGRITGLSGVKAQR